MIDPFIWYLTGWVSFTAPSPFGPFGPHTKFEVLLAKNIQSMDPVDKGLQWVNVKQKPFRQI